jgi:hypothetical protein
MAQQGVFQAMNLRRLPDWPERLYAYLQQHASTPFAWGSNDCVRFAAGAVRAITGNDVLPTTWRDRAQAAVVLRSLGGLVPAVDTVLPRLQSAALAQRGDVLLVQATVMHGGRRRWLAVADSGRWWCPSPQGLVRGPIDQAVMAWGVAHG